MNKLTIKFSVFILFSICYFLPSAARASILYAGAAQQNVYENQSIVIDWFLDTENKSINSLDLKLRFSAGTLALAEATTGNSVVSLWIQQPKAMPGGEIGLTGGVPGGAMGKNLPVFRTVFLALSPGLAKISMEPASKVLLNDGKGTEDKLTFTELIFTVSPASANLALIKSSSHPDQNQWYRNNKAVIIFTPQPGEQYAYSFSSNLDILPENQPSDVPREIRYNNLPDGIYYFKLNSRRGANAWSEAGVYRIQIDQTPPEDFKPVIGEDLGLFGGKPFLSFVAVDKTSGIDRYEIKQGLFGRFSKADSPYALKRPLVGDKVIVRAIDRAGHALDAIFIYGAYVSVKLFYFLLAGLIIFALVLLYIYKLRTSKK